MSEYEKEVVRFSVVTFLVLIITYITSTFYVTNLDMSNWQSSSNVFEDKKLGWDFKNFKKHGFNDCGLRDSLSCSEIKKMTNKKKVLFLGNSVVMGKGIKLEETFVKVFQDKIGSNVYGLNAGYGGYEIYREFYKYKRDLSDLGVSTVYWVISRNDLRSSSTLGSVIEETKESQGGQLKKSFGSTFMFNLKKGRSVKVLKQQFIILAGQWFDSWKDHHYANGLLQSPGVNVVEAVVSEVERFNRFLRIKNTKLVVLYLPDRTFSRFYNFSDSRMFNIFHKEFSKRGIKGIKLVKPFKNNSMIRYFKDYVHLSEEGHRLVGESTALQVMQRNLEI